MVGTKGQIGNRNCTWDYNPTNNLGSVSFQSGWNQTVTFLDSKGFTITSTSQVTGAAKPTITPNGTSGDFAAAAITLDDVAFNVSSGSTLYLQGFSSGNAVFMKGTDPGEFLDNKGTVSYTGAASTKGTAYVDYLKVPVHNDTGGVFMVNGNGVGGQSSTGAALQVIGADKINTNGVSFYQDSSTAETDLSDNGTLWCVNDYWMAAGLLQTKDIAGEYLKVGIGGKSPVDGTVTLVSGSVNINPLPKGSIVAQNPWGTLYILGTTTTNAPTLNIGSGVTLNFKVDMTVNKNNCDKLVLGTDPMNPTGYVNFGYNGGKPTVNILPQNGSTTGHKWQVIFFKKKDGDVNVTPTGFTPNWKPTYLEIDN